jgi:hypothetical protein
MKAYQTTWTENGHTDVTIHRCDPGKCIEQFVKTYGPIKQVVVREINVTDRQTSLKLITTGIVKQTKK